jgi:glycosyltransferase involved in cell wall biosynthesis
MEPPLDVSVNGWFAGARVGSGVYTDALVAGLRALDVRDSYHLVAPAGRSDLGKAAFEQWHFPRAAADANVALVPYWGPPLVCRAPVVVTVHDLIPLVVAGYRRALRVRLYSRLAVAATRRADAVIADSERTARDIRARLGVDGRRVHVVPLGVAPFRVAGAAGASGTQAGLVSETGERVPERYGLYLGGFDARKNVAMLVEVWRGVYALTGVPLVIAGAADAALRALAGPGPEIRFVGEVSEATKARLYGSASVFAYPSLYEGFGLPPLEAMSAGVPVVASDASSLPEVVGDAGIVLPPSGRAAWVQSLFRILTDDGLAAELSARGRARASLFTWEATAARTRAVLAAVALRRSGH